MATYKLIQDIEAEDHILGPLTLRQFIFGLIAAFLIYLCFISITKHFAFMLAVFVPPALFCLFFAIPFGMDQPTEVWALAKIRYLFKPRTRIWNQSGVKEMVTVTAPKRVETLPPVKNYSQTEVKSRLRALADTIDSRGWVVKNVNPYLPQAVAAGPDRLLDLDSLPQPVAEFELDKTGDMLDTSSNPLAQQFDNMMTESQQEHRQQLISQLNSPEDLPAPALAAPAEPDSYWFMRTETAAAAPANPPIVAPSAPSVTAMGSDDALLVHELQARQALRSRPYEHLRTLQPLSSTPPQTPPTEVAQDATAMTAAPDPDILSLANNNDLSVTALANEAKRTKNKKQEPPTDEVVISLR